MRLVALFLLASAAIALPLGDESGSLMPDTQGATPQQTARAVAPILGSAVGVLREMLLAEKEEHGEMMLLAGDLHKLPLTGDKAFRLCSQIRPSRRARHSLYLICCIPPSQGEG